MDKDSPKLGTFLWIPVLVMGGYLAIQMFLDPPSASQADATAASSPDSAAQAQGAPEATGRASDGSQQRPQPPARSPEERLAVERRLPLRGEGYVAEVSNLAAAITRFALTEPRFLEDSGEGKNLVTTEKESYLPGRLEVAGVDVPADAVWTVLEASEQLVRLRWTDGVTSITRRFETGTGLYQLWITDRLSTSAGERTVRAKLTTHHYVPREDEGGGGLFSRPSLALSHAVCAHGSDVVRLTRDDALGAHGFGPATQFAGVENQYFATLLAATTPAERCQLGSSDRGGTPSDPHGSLFEARLLYPWTALKPGEDLTYRTLAFMGPKSGPAMEAAGHGIPRVIDRGWFSAIAELLVQGLRWIYEGVGNWGLAIILLTVAVRVLLFPLTYKSFQSMARMRVLKPEMDRINEMYGEDRERKGAAIMEMYRKHKINPLGGCLPQLLQLPVWFAFYASLSTNVELYHAAFGLWLIDLSAPDPYFVLPLILGGLMFFQQKITPTTMDPMQAKMMLYMMPIMMMAFMLFLPAGLCLYMVTNSVLGIAQQQWIHRQSDQAAATAASGAPPTSPAGALEGPSPSATTASAGESRNQKRRTRRARG